MSDKREDFPPVAFEEVTPMESKRQQQKITEALHKIADSDDHSQEDNEGR